MLNKSNTYIKDVPQKLNATKVRIIDASKKFQQGKFM